MWAKILNNKSSWVIHTEDYHDIKNGYLKKKQMFVITPRKFHVAPENRPSQKESNLPTIIFQGRTVKFLWVYPCPNKKEKPVYLDLQRT